MPAGRPRLSPEEHERRGRPWAARAARDAMMTDEGEHDVNGEPVDKRLLVSDADRAALLRGLPPFARQLADRVLECFWDFDPAAQHTLRAGRWAGDRRTHAHADRAGARRRSGGGQSGHAVHGRIPLKRLLS